MIRREFRQYFIHWLIQGLSEGLSRFLREHTRVALIFGTYPDDLKVYDYQGLLGAHRLEMPSVLNRIVRLERFPTAGEVFIDKTIVFVRAADPQKDDIGSSLAIWYAECELRDGQKFLDPWLKQADKFLIDYWDYLEDVFDYSPSVVLEHFADDAVGSVVLSKCFPEEQDRNYEQKSFVERTLELMQALSVVEEEHKLSSGIFASVPKARATELRLDFEFAREKRAKVANAKYVRKLLGAVRWGTHALVSDGREIIGLTRTVPLEHRPIVAKYGRGLCSIFVGDEPICEIANGEFLLSRTSSLRRVKQMIAGTFSQSQLLETAIERLITNANLRGHGCTMVIGTKAALANSLTKNATSQRIMPAIDLSNPKLFELASGIAAVDGALLITTGAKLVAFSTLLDGLCSVEENPARGARFNSALRFSKSNPGLIIVVVSEDGPVSVFANGAFQNSKEVIELSDIDDLAPSLREWLEGRSGYSVKQLSQITVPAD